MAITAIGRYFVGAPNIVGVITDDTIDTITSEGYLLNESIVNDIEELQHGGFQWEDTDIVLISYQPNFAVNWFKYDSENSTFIQNSEGGSLSNALTNGHMFIGNASNIATDVAMSGIINISNTGLTTLPLTNGNILIGNGSNIAAGVPVSGSINISNAGVATIPLSNGHILVGNGSNVAADVAVSGSVNISNAGSTSLNLSNGLIFVGNGSNVATGVSMSGDVTISNSGTTTLSPLIRRYTNTTLTSAEFKGMYENPKLLVAAPGPLDLLLLDQIVLAFTYASIAYTDGGNVTVQYDSTPHGAGSIASTTLGEADFQGADDVLLPFNPPESPFNAMQSVGKGLYLSNITQPFDTGEGNFVVHIWYRLLTG